MESCQFLNHPVDPPAIPHNPDLYLYGPVRLHPRPPCTRHKCPRTHWYHTSTRVGLVLRLLGKNVRKIPFLVPGMSHSSGLE